MKRQLVGKISVLFCGAMLSASSSMAAVTFDWAVIGNAGNAADPQTGYGSIGYEYSMATTEVTTSQYVEFLNAVAGVDTYGLYNSSMANSPYYKGISITEGSGTSLDPYKYSSNAGWANRPVEYVSWYDSLRFTNWLHNGQLSGAQDASTTEDGAYTFSGATSVSARNIGASYWLPNEDEWYKAAYYSPSGVYYDYPTGSDSVPVSGVDANYNATGYVDPVYFSTEVGAYDNDSPYGTYDQGGNVWEWTETIMGSGRIMRGGSWGTSVIYLASSDLHSHDYPYAPTFELYNVGFRVASFESEAIPEPLSVGLVLLSAGGLILRRLKRI